MIFKLSIKKPIEGPERVVKRFFWTPTIIAGYFVWLETYYTTEVYSPKEGKWIVFKTILIDEK